MTTMAETMVEEKTGSPATTKPAPLLVKISATSPRGHGHAHRDPADALLQNACRASLLADNSRQGE